MANQPIPIDVVALLPVLDLKLLELLRSLDGEEWNKQTIARQWKVKDVVAHLLDGNIRVLSSLRDNHTVAPTVPLSSYDNLVNYLNGLNAEWVGAMRRVSPRMLIFLLELTGPPFCTYYAKLNPFDDAAFPVAWAGDTVSKNWKHIAREYTEKWHHQQQIREAVNRPGLMSRELFQPFMEILMLGLPHTYRNVVSDEGTTIKLTVSTEIGSAWFLTRSHGAWVLGKQALNAPDAEIQIHPDIAWRLFSKSIRPLEILDQVTLTGDQELGKTALHMVSVMA
jgi:hypothetical protein